MGLTPTDKVRSIDVLVSILVPSGICTDAQCSTVMSSMVDHATRILAAPRFIKEIIAALEGGFGSVRLARRLDLPQYLLALSANGLVYQCRWCSQLCLDVSPECSFRLLHSHRCYPFALLPHGLANGLTFGHRRVF